MENEKNWLDQLLDELDWTPADLARATKIDSAVISNIRNGIRGIGIDTAIAIGKATNKKPETILRLAGRLPELPEVDEWVDDTAHKLALLPESYRSLTRKFIRSLLDDEKAPDGDPNPKPKSSTL